MEARIRELEHVLHFSILTNGPANTESVGVGSTVSVRDTAGTEKTYTIVGVNESNPTAGKVTNESPIGEALLHRKVGDTIHFETPGGTRTVTIISIT